LSDPETGLWTDEIDHFDSIAESAPLIQTLNLITDYLLGALAMALGILLLGRAARPSRLWGYALVALAFAAFAGGTWHGFQAVFAGGVLFWLWKAAVYLAAVFGLAAASGTIIATTSGHPRRALLAAMIAISVVYAVIMTMLDDFIYVIAFDATAMALVLVLHLRSGRSRHDPASPWIVAGIAVSVIGAIVQASGLSLNEYFNNNDLFHVVQMAGVYLLFRGAWRLGEGGATP